MGAAFGTPAERRQRAARRTVGAGVPRQLALHRRGGRLLGVVQPALDVRPPVEPGDRGAVLPPVAARGRRRVAVGAAAAARALRRHVRRRHRRLVRSRCCCSPTAATRPGCTWAPTPGRRRCSPVRWPPRRRAAGSSPRWSPGSGADGVAAGGRRRARAVVVGRRRRGAARRGCTAAGCCCTRWRAPWSSSWSSRRHRRRAGAASSGGGRSAWIGVISYGLYLWHWPVYVVAVARAHGPRRGRPLLALRIAVSAGFAVASFRLVENPIRRRAAWARGAGRRRRPSRRAVAARRRRARRCCRRRPPRSPPSTRLGRRVAPVSTPRPPTGDDHHRGSRRRPRRRAARRAPPAPTAARRRRPPAPRRRRPRADDDRPAATTTHRRRWRRSATPCWAGDSIAWDMAPGGRRVAGRRGCRRSTRRRGVRRPPARRARRGYTDSSTRCVCGSRSDGADTVIMQLSVWDARLRPAEQGAALAAHARRRRRSRRPPRLRRPPGRRATRDERRRRDDGRGGRALDAADPEQRRASSTRRRCGDRRRCIDLDGDGTPERKRDLIHVCPSGAARFGAWLAGELAARFEAVTPAPPTDWAGRPVGHRRPLRHARRRLRAPSADWHGVRHRAATTMRATRSWPASVSAPDSSRHGDAAVAVAGLPPLARPPRVVAGLARRGAPGRRRGTRRRRARRIAGPRRAATTATASRRLRLGERREARRRAPPADSTTCSRVDLVDQPRPGADGSSHHAVVERRPAHRTAVLAGAQLDRPPPPARRLVGDDEHAEAVVVRPARPRPPRSRRARPRPATTRGDPTAAVTRHAPRHRRRTIAGDRERTPAATTTTGSAGPGCGGRRRTTTAVIEHADRRRPSSTQRAVRVEPR